MDWSELTNWTEYTKLLVGLLAITAPLGASTVFMGYVGHLEKKQQNLTALISVVAYFIMLTVFIYLGDAILAFFGITLAAFRVAGGLLLLLSGLDMLRSESESEESDAERSKETNPIAIGIAPLAIPLLAGPGAISTIIVYAGAHHESLSHLILVTMVVLTVALIIYAAFLGVLRMGHLFNDTTSMIINRVMGLIITSIAVEFIFDGIAGHFPQLITIH